MRLGLWGQHVVQEKGFLQTVSERWDGVMDPLKMLCGVSGGLALDGLLRLTDIGPT